jgi:Uma2 family endonuclease
MATVTVEPVVRRSEEASLPHYRLTVEKYRRMVDAGILDDARCELLEGLLVEKMPINPPHGAAVTRLNRRLSRLLSDEWVLFVQSPISVPRSQPEPDLAIARGPEGQYNTRHPSGREIMFVIEVADSSLAVDRGMKRRMYAAAHIPVYWVVNLIDGQIEVYTLPRAGRAPTYRVRQDFQREESVPLVIAGQEVTRLRVNELLP